MHREKVFKIFYYFSQLYCPNEISPMGNSGWFPRESQLRQSRYLTYGACWVFYCFHNPPNSGMDYRIFNMHSDVNACDCTQGCTDTAESLHWILTGRKIPRCTGESTCVSRVPVWCSTNWATPPLPFSFLQWPLKFLPTRTEMIVQYI